MVRVVMAAMLEKAELEDSAGPADRPSTGWQEHLARMEMAARVDWEGPAGSGDSGLQALRVSMERL